MAITINEVLCGNQWRHKPAQPPAAVAFVRDHASNGPGWTPRCRSCVASLAAANPASCRADVVYIAADQPDTDDPAPDVPACGHDHDPADVAYWVDGVCTAPA